MKSTQPKPHEENSILPKKRKLSNNTLSTTTATATKTTKSQTPLRQSGTGLHLDSWPYNLWGKLNKNYSYDKLDRFRPFQSMLCLSDGDLSRNLEEGGLELVPGFASIAKEYLEASDKKFRETTGLKSTTTTMRRKSPWVSPYHIKFVENDKEDSPLFDLIRKVKRVPKNWQLVDSNHIQPLAINSTKDDARDQYLKYLKEIVKEHDNIPYEPIQRGDYIFFDVRMPHQNSKHNYMSYPRCVFYHAYEMVHPINMNTVASLKEKRKTFDHPDDFSSEFTMEKNIMDVTNEEHLIPLTPLGECLFREKSHSHLFDKQQQDSSSDMNGQATTTKFDEMYEKYGHMLSKRHLEFFHRYGYVVVEKMVSREDCNQLLKELGEYSKKAGCSLPTDSIINKHRISARVSKEDFRKISGPFGSMIEFFYLPTQQRLRMSEAIYCATVKLVANTWCCNLEVSSTFQEGTIPKWQYQCPIEKELDPRKLWTYVDRMNFRYPNKL